jgi:hypothetical protein
MFQVQAAGRRLSIRNPVEAGGGRREAVGRRPGRNRR